MSPAGRDDCERIDAEAREWLLRRSLEDRAAADEAAFQAWLDADQRHGECYALAEAVWTDLQNMKGRPELAALSESPRRRSGIAIGIGIAAAILIASVLGFWSHQQDATRQRQSYATGTAEIRTLLLPDGTVVSLGARTKISTEFSDRERLVQLSGGEALFAVTRDSRRPFIVRSGNARVRVLGTRFELRSGEGRLRIGVAEGVIEVISATQPPHSSAANRHVLTAGQQVAVTPAGEFSAIERAQAPGAWTGGHFRYDGAPLADVVSDASRYHPRPIELESPDLGRLRVSTSFGISQIAQMIDTLPDVLPVSVENQADGTIVLRRRAAGE
jgi:transmembrane sensor